MEMKQLTEAQAINFADSKLYTDWSFKEIARFQIQQTLLCMPFDVFHEAVEKTLMRSVFTHEFGMNMEGIKQELLNGGDSPSFDDIMNMLPKEKTIFVNLD
jgi:hypothetical protein